LPGSKNRKETTPGNQLSREVKSARYLLSVVFNAVIMLVWIFGMKSSRQMSATQAVVLFRDGVAPLLLSTLSVASVIWTTYTMEGFPRTIKNNANMILPAIAIAGLYVFSVIAMLSGFDRQYFSDIVLISMAVLGYGFLKTHLSARPAIHTAIESTTVLTGPAFLAGNIGILQISVVVLIVVSVFSFLAWYFIASREVLPGFEIAVAVLLIANIDAYYLVMRHEIVRALKRVKQLGITINSVKTLNRIAGITTVVFSGMEFFVSKTPELAEIVPVGTLTVPGLLRLSAGLSSAAGMIYSDAIMKAAHDELATRIPMPTEFKIIEGCGVEGIIETRGILIGNKRFMVERNIDTEPIREIVERHAARGSRILYVASNDKIAGVFAFEFRPNLTARKLVADIKAKKVSVALMTSENQRIADVLAESIGIDNVYMVTQPLQRKEKIAELRSLGRRVAVVGGPASDLRLLGSADVYIGLRDVDYQDAMGAVENSPAGNSDEKMGIENVVYVNERLSNVASVIEVGRDLRQAIRNNFVMLAIYNALAVLVTAVLVYPLAGVTVRPALAAVIPIAFSLIVLSVKRRNATDEDES
jgi:cation transport ATPase